MSNFVSGLTIGFPLRNRGSRYPKINLEVFITHFSLSPCRALLTHKIYNWITLLEDVNVWQTGYQEPWIPSYLHVCQSFLDSFL